MRGPDDTNMDGRTAITAYVARLDAFHKSDLEREELVKEVIQKYEDLKVRYDEKVDDYNNEVASRRMWQSKATQCELALAAQQQVSGSNNFALALIDGDGAIFQDYLYASGKDGGGDAAHQLHKGLQDHLKAIYPKANVSDWSIVVQVVLNMQGLATKLASCGVFSSPNELPGFARAFGLAQPLFSFVDVGSGKERADHKIRETLRLYVPNAQCKHVFFAPCHDNGYLPVLERYRRDSDIASRLTLIETRSAEPGFVELGLNFLRLPRIFRSDNLAPTPLLPTRTLTSGHVSSNPYIPPIPKAESPVPSVGSTSSTTNSATNSNAASWATIGKNSTKNGVAAKTINIATKKNAQPRRFILLNVYNDRLDAELPRTDPGAESRFTDRMKAHGKCCNSYYLTGKCEAGEYCDYYHGERLTPGEMLVLKHKARSRSCPMRTACMDPDCTFGHVCKFGRQCFLDVCYFSSSHGIDLTPAKKQYDDGTEEWLPNYVNKFSGS